MASEGCPHFTAPPAAPRSEVCEDCGATHSLRVCTTCGYVGCCESYRAHDTQHARASGHPVIQSLPVGGRQFTWCYECRAYV